LTGFAVLTGIWDFQILEFFNRLSPKRTPNAKYAFRAPDTTEQQDSLASSRIAVSSYETNLPEPWCKAGLRKTGEIS
jgi:hypothetical protein